MEYTGLIRKYCVDRLLSEQDNQGRVEQSERQDVLPHPHLATLRLNGTYLEVVDKFYESRGFLAIVMLALSVMGIVGIGLGAYIVHGAIRSEDQQFVAVPVLIAELAVITLTYLSVWLFRREAFRLTHYPIRLNRKTRKVYAFDARTLKIIEADWDSMFFTILPTRTRPIGVTQWEILGHIMDEDQVTIRHTIPFSIVWSQRDDVVRHWEYLRRYMEEGPQAVIDHTPVCLPIAEQKETFVFGFLKLFAPFSSVLFFVPGGIMAFFEAIGRYIAMQTSKIPQWPAHIEAECQVDPDDPYAIDASDNPPSFWKSTDKLRSDLVAQGLIVR